MRLKKQNNNRIIIIAIIAVVVVLALVVGGIFLFSITNNGKEPKPDDIIGIELSSRPSRTEYLVGEQFQSKGAKVQVMTHDYEKSYFVDYSELSFSGYDSESAGEKLITVTYKGFTTTFTVTVKEKNDTPAKTSIEVCDFKLEYTLDRWNQRSPSTYGSYFKITRPDGAVYGSPDETPITGNNIVNYEKVDGPCEFDLIISYVDTDDTQYTVTVTITITN